MKSCFQRIGVLALLLLMLVAGYTLLMLAAYSFPDAWVEKNVTAALGVLEEEGNMPGGYGTYFWHSGFGITDNLTDKEIYKGLLRGERSVTDAAMRTDYSRYWHGYAVILRPLSVVLSIINIRYVNMLLLMGFLMLCYWHCRRRFGGGISAAFVIALLMHFFLIAPFCQQYVPVSLLTLMGCYAVLRWWERLRQRLLELFLLLGSLVCFFDFLTFPVLALGYPLICCLLCRLDEGKNSLWAEMIALSAAWMAGYALTWLGKGAVGTLLTGENVFENILSQVALRTNAVSAQGEQTIEITALSAIGINVETFFMGSNIALLFVMLLASGVWAIKRRAPACEWLRALPLAIIALYPFLWALVLQNHVRIHFWMTHKQFSVTVFALCAYLLWIAGRARRETRENG